MRVFCSILALALGLSSLGAPVVTPELSTDWILKTIHDRNITDLEKLLATFQTKSLQYHLYSYGSESLQKATWLSPRVIVYTYDADFIMAFNGDSSLPGFYDLEILRFDHKDWKFIPEVIHFDPKGKAAPRPDLHPTECADCHQKDIRPNWEPYFHWVGFYGSEDDNLNTAGGGTFLTGTVETNHFKQFLAKQSNEKEIGQGRYRFLPKHPAERPNLHFNDRMTCLNMKRMLRNFASHPEADRLWSAVRSGNVYLDEIPEELKKRARRTFEEVLADTETGTFKAAQARLARHTLLTGEADPKGRPRFMRNNHGALVKETNDAAQWRYVYEEILGEDFRPQSTSRHFDYQLNIGALIDLGHLIHNSEIDRNGKFQHHDGYPIGRSEQDYNYYCPVGQTVLEKSTRY